VYEQGRCYQPKRRGKTLNEIIAAVNFPKTTVWGWIRHVKLTDEQREKINNFGNNHSKVKAQKAASAAMVEKFKIQKEEDRERGREFIRSFKVLPADVVAIVMLYWAEGSKTHSFGFCNSDASMLKLFMGVGLKYAFLERDKLRIAINFYDNVKGQEEVEEYWLELLGLERHQLYKTQINKRPQERAGSKIGKLPYGVCTIYHSTKRKRYEMDGMMEEVKKILGA
jgi:hypothetical protein